jgi:spermidine/putrescine transport system permease protein
MAAITAPSTTSGPRGSAPTPRGRSASSRALRWVRNHITQAYAALALLFLFLPVAYVLLFSFNNTSSRFNERWTGFTWTYWRHPCAVPGMCNSLKVSLQLGAIATVGATLLGTMIAFALVRHRFRGRTATNLLIFLPMATPEVVMGSSLLTLFVNQASPLPLGFWTIAIAHIMFDISFVVVTVKARLQGLDPRLEQAAMDLYATPFQTLRRVTMPLVMPGIVAAALLAFALSFDDFIITDFNAGSVVTFPMFVYGAHQRGVPPQINVIGSLTFFLALAFTAIGQIGRGRSAKKHA